MAKIKEEIAEKDLKNVNGGQDEGSDARQAIDAIKDQFKIDNQLKPNTEGIETIPTGYSQGGAMGQQKKGE